MEQLQRLARAKSVKLPAGYWVEWGGAFENQQRAMARLGIIVPLTIGLIFILLYTAFNSVRHATLIIANVPFAIIGGLVGLFITGRCNLWRPFPQYCVAEHERPDHAHIAGIIPVSDHAVDHGVRRRRSPSEGSPISAGRSM